jgi:toxin ParE1/3/4
MAFKLAIDIRALQDVQEAINYYDQQQLGLGRHFEIILNNHLQILQKNPFFRIRYDEVRCLPLKNFPYMIHYVVYPNINQVYILAVFHTSAEPEKWKKL